MTVLRRAERAYKFHIERNSRSAINQQLLSGQKSKSQQAKSPKVIKKADHKTSNGDAKNATTNAEERNKNDEETISLIVTSQTKMPKNIVEEEKNVLLDKINEEIIEQDCSEKN